MREISPAQNLSAEEYLVHLPPPFRALVRDIRAQKESGQRPRSSTGLVDRSAALGDENLTGRADMCLQSSMLLQRALRTWGFPRVSCAMLDAMMAEERAVDH
jgi:hypothetical protein